MDKALDGGWGWMIVLAVHFMHFLTGGLDRATGVFYREILYDMQESSASTAGFTALLFSSRFLSGPVAGVLCKFFCCRRVMMAGGLISFVGVLLSSFCRSLSLIYLTLGFMTGVGNGLAYTSGLLAVNDYFSRRKATALGLATAGTGVGSFVLPLLTQYLIQVYSFRGCMLILSGLSLNLVVCGALLYPLPQAAVGEEKPAESVALRAVEGAEKNGDGMKPDEEHSAKQPVSADAQPLQTADPAPVSPCRRFFIQLWENFDLKLFLNWQFSVYALAALFISAGFKPVAVILPHHGQLKGLTRTTSVLLISIAGELFAGNLRIKQSFPELVQWGQGSSAVSLSIHDPPEFVRFTPAWRANFQDRDSVQS